MSKQVLVYGWYNHGNVGDDLFPYAFRKLFPEYQFSFCDQLTRENIEKSDAIVFGGGSFLDQEISIDTYYDDVLPLDKTILYVGVGCETDICAQHRELLKRAQLIATRTFNIFNAQCANTIYIPDLVYALNDDTQHLAKDEKTILVLPNCGVIPTWNNPMWKHTAWEQFKVEFAQVLEHFYALGYRIDFYPMCHNPQESDQLAAMELLGKTSQRNLTGLLPHQTANIGSITQLFSSYELIITQRYHGAILAEMARTKYLSIWHHNKLKSSFCREGYYSPYYGFNKDSCITALEQLEKQKLSPNLSLGSHSFKELQERMRSIID